MDITITAYGGIKQVRLSGNTILLAGKGGAGKTSVLNAVRAALTGQPRPAAVAKKDALSLVHRGQTEGDITMGDEGGSVTVLWPSCEVRQRGNPVTASQVAAGLVSPLDMSPADRAALLIGLLKAEPSAPELEQALAEAELSKNMIAHTVASVARLGWDGALKDATEARTKRKGAWERGTGQKRYGEKIAESWRPEGWSADLGLVTVQALQVAVETAKEGVEAALKAGASDDGEIARLSERVKLTAAARIRLEEAERVSQREAAAAAALGRKLDALPPVPSAGVACPECGCLLQVSGGHLERATGVAGPETIAAAIEVRAGIKRAYADADATANAAVKAEAELRAELAALERDRKRFDELMASRRQPAVGGGDVETARAALALAEARLKAVVAMGAAKADHQMVGALSSIIAVLAQEGLRKKKLADTLGAFNSQLAALCDLAGLPPVALTDDLGATYGGMPYATLSTSQRYLARLALQVAIANLDKSSALVVDVDRALDGGQKGAVIEMLNQGARQEIAFIIAAITETEPWPALDITDIGGRTYWVEGGEVTRFTAQTAQAGAA